MWRKAPWLLIVFLAATVALTRRRLGEAYDEIARLRLELLGSRERAAAPPAGSAEGPVPPPPPGAAQGTGAGASTASPPAAAPGEPAAEPDLATAYEQAVPPRDS